MYIAEKIAENHSDGQRYDVDIDGVVVNIIELASQVSGEKIRHLNNQQPAVFIFEDGSAIIDFESNWDIWLPNAITAKWNDYCYMFIDQWGGHHCLVGNEWDPLPEQEELIESRHEERRWLTHDSGLNAEILLSGGPRDGQTVDF